ncbi:MAG: hypothetical protein VX278_21780, partial [Myxococcota bacterium]|nr:hypothetical protein [Myxococcota bacterium]
KKHAIEHPKYGVDKNANRILKAPTLIRILVNDHKLSFHNTEDLSRLKQACYNKLADEDAFNRRIATETILCIRENTSQILAGREIHIGFDYIPIDVKEKERFETTIHTIRDSNYSSESLQPLDDTTPSDITHINIFPERLPSQRGLPLEPINVQIAKGVSYQVRLVPWMKRGRLDRIQIINLPEGNASFRFHGNKASELELYVDENPGEDSIVKGISKKILFRDSSGEIYILKIQID